MEQSTDYRSKLGKVKGLGAAHHGVSHWWVQRMTALALIPLTLWFVYSLVHGVITPDAAAAQAWFTQPLNALVTVLMLVAAFWHAKLGAQVVIEDYVHTPASKYLLLLANTFFCFGVGTISVLAVLKLHFQIAL